MAFRVSMKVKGFDTTVDELQALQARLADLRPAWVVVRAIFYNIERELFDSNGASGAGGAWEELADSTIRKKIAAGYSAEDILQATTALYKSLTAPNQLGSRYISLPGSLTIGTAIASSAFHDSGTEHMPQRRPIDPTEDDMLIMVEVVDKWVRGESFL